MPAFQETTVTPPAPQKIKPADEGDATGCLKCIALSTSDAVIGVFKTTLQVLPLVNFAYYVFFHKTPSTDDIIDISNSNLLVSALVFTIVASIPLSIAQEEMNMADFDYSLEGKVCVCCICICVCRMHS